MVWVVRYGLIPALITGFVMSVTEKDGQSEDQSMQRDSLLTRPFAAIGRKTINWVNTLGAATIFLVLAVLMIFRPKQWTKVIEQIYYIGARSTTIIVLVALFTGMVLG
ncbi:MAG TPA: hypothetical protein P5573_00260, partial [Syntrophales bacterium]|nr:hypothetical protein [Syntrophales bacterium]